MFIASFNCSFNWLHDTILYLLMLEFNATTLQLFPAKSYGDYLSPNNFLEWVLDLPIFWSNKLVLFWIHCLSKKTQYFFPLKSIKFVETIGFRSLYLDVLVRCKQFWFQEQLPAQFWNFHKWVDLLIRRQLYREFRSTFVQLKKNL